MFTGGTIRVLTHGHIFAADRRRLPLRLIGSSASCWRRRGSASSPKPQNPKPSRMRGARLARFFFALKNDKKGFPNRETFKRGWQELELAGLFESTLLN